MCGLGGLGGGGFGLRIGVPLSNYFPFIFGDPIGIQPTNCRVLKRGVFKGTG